MIYNQTKVDREKTNLPQGGVGPSCDDDLKVALKTARQDTNKLNLLLSFYMEKRYTCAPEQMLPYMLQSCKLADSLIAQPIFKNNYSLKKKLAKSYNILGIIHSVAQNHDSALIYYHKALTMRESIGDSAGIAQSYNNISTIYRIKGDFVAATRYNLKALSISEKCRDSTAMAYAYYHLSRNNVNINNTQKALTYALRCVEIRKKARQIALIPESLSNLSEIYRLRGDTLRSLNLELEALHLSDSLGMLSPAANSLNNIASFYKEKGQLDLALSYYKKAAKLHGFLDDKFHLAITSHNISRILATKGDFAGAKRLTLEHLETLKNYSEAVLVGAYDLLAQCDSALGNFKEAFLYAQSARAQHDANQNAEKTNAVNELETKYAVSQKEAENKLLAQQNQIQQLELKRNRYFIAALVGGTLLILLVGLLLVRQAGLRAREANRAMEQRLLRSQMNPHFIFNCLQAIQNYMLKSEVKDSIRYLNTFAVITREVLENSRTEYIPLAKDIKLLKNYLELQKLRFTDRFEYAFHLHQELEASPVLIPPMLFQPFIENAIEHGMSDMESGGKIDLYYKITEGYLVMEIADNGKGLGNSTTDKKPHESLATTITKERIELMNKRSKSKLVFALEEAYPEAPARKGVKVIFRIPLTLSQQGKSILGFN